MIFFNEYYFIALFAASWIFWALVPQRFRTLYIIGLSAAGLAFIQWEFTLFLFLLVLAVHALGRLVERRDGKGRWLALSVLALAIVLLGAKYSGRFYGLLFSEEADFAKNYLVPLGVSYLCFKLIAYVIDIYRGIIEKPRMDDLLAFILFIPTFPAGPIERFQDFVSKRKEKFEADFYVEGLRRLAIGYFKKVVIVNFIFNETLIKHLYPQIMADGVSTDLSAATVILFLMASLVYAYIDLSAYADIAIGFGRLFGYEICENMRYPIFQRNLSEYWNRWHMSLSGWCRNNVYFPVLGATRNLNMALCASFLVMGIWHNVSLNWMLWGLWHASGIIVYSKWSRFVKKARKRYKRKYGKLPPKLPANLGYVIGMFLTSFYAGLGFAFIMTDGKAGFFESAQQALRLLLAIVI